MDNRLVDTYTLDTVFGPSNLSHPKRKRINTNVIIVFGQHGPTPYIYSHGHNMDKDKDDMRFNSKMVQFSGKIGGVGGGGLTNLVGRGRA